MKNTKKDFSLKSPKKTKSSKNKEFKKQRVQKTKSSKNKEFKKQRVQKTNPLTREFKKETPLKQRV
ncbi:hypothetical protein FIM81_03110 [Helicobacter pylori]|nr:hypothetical protein FIM81_03110 [Helicobacter pylori]